MPKFLQRSCNHIQRSNWLLQTILFHNKTTEDVPECVVSHDAEKASNQVKWAYFFCCAGQLSFGFGPNFTTWIILLYSHPTASICTNTQWSTPLSLHCRTRQRCLLGPMLFNMAIEPLATALCTGMDISGTMRGDTEHRISLYGDNLLLLISCQLPHCPLLCCCSVSLVNFQVINLISTKASSFLSTMRHKLWTLPICLLK